MANNDNSPTSDMSRNHRGSVASAALSGLFQRSNSTSTASTGTPIFPGAITSAALDPNRRRRLSISTTSALGLSGASPVSAGGGNSGGGPAALGMRRASMSTTSSVSDAAIDESAIEDDDAVSRSAPIARRMSAGGQAMFNLRGPGGTSPGGTSSNGRRRSHFSPSAGGGQQRQQRQQQQQQRSQRASVSSTSPVPHSQPFPIPSSSSPSSSSPYYQSASSPLSPRTASDKFRFPAARPDQRYNWSEQFRSRAESSVAAGSRASFSFASGMGNSPPRAGGGFSHFAGFAAGHAGGGVGSGGGVMRHDRSQSVSDVPTPAAPQAPRPRRGSRPKPDHFQERILKGDFYMD